jgi:N6-adenosine-specific RNA methylase IME4
LARRGSPKRRSAKVRELIVSPRREHSRKPDEIHERIERYCAGPYVELFARSSRKGWKTWGAEATKFDQPMREAAE